MWNVNSCYTVENCGEISISLLRLLLVTGLSRNLPPYANSFVIWYTMKKICRNWSSLHLAPRPMTSRAFSSPLHLLPLERGEALYLSGKEEHLCYRPSTHPYYSVSYSKCLSSSKQDRSFEGRSSPTLREDAEVIFKWRRATCFPIMCPIMVLLEPNLAIRWPITSAISPGLRGVVHRKPTSPL